MKINGLNTESSEFRLIANMALIALFCTLMGCDGDGDEGTGGPNDDFDGDGIVNSLDIDDDNDGLIEIATLEQLDWMRNSATGEYMEDHSGNRMTEGCLDDLCTGYELVADLDFDTNSNGVRDAGDTYFDYDNDGLNAGWFTHRQYTRSGFQCEF